VQGNIRSSVKPWAKERILNEAAALKLIKEKTSIPVPTILSFGTHEDGTAYLVTERISGIEFDIVGDQCRMPEGQDHNYGGPCNNCEMIAKAKAQRFIEETMLSQLATLKSDTTGLNGFVLPPRPILEYDKRLDWAPMKSDHLEYVFTNGDLAAHNIIVHPETLEVVSVFDWEHSGYFPQEFQQWSLDRITYYKQIEDHNRIRKLIALYDTQRA
jgi:aminoglycoside phosphotransferase (APT) family kinase protein